MKRAYYSDAIESFLDAREGDILESLNAAGGDRLQDQGRAWEAQIKIMKDVLQGYSGRGKIYFEWEIPRLGGRIDVLVLIDNVVFVIEFKVGEGKFKASDRDQASGYAVELKNFHETSHDVIVAPILVATASTKRIRDNVASVPRDRNLLFTTAVGSGQLKEAIQETLEFARGLGASNIPAVQWERGRYKPTTTIIEVVRQLYEGHTVNEIMRRGADDMSKTSSVIANVIEDAKRNSYKAICFVTGVPGSGKTLVGLDLAVKGPESREDGKSEQVFLSGNRPLVEVLREALIQDEVARRRKTNKEKGIKGKVTKELVSTSLKAPIQEVHHFRDEYIKDKSAPQEHVAIFDEAQRAWNADELTNFMSRRKGIKNFNRSEPEFLISCLNRHDDWAVVVCLVGGGQEIKRGEAGISEWLKAIAEVKELRDWHVYISPELESNSEYGVSRAKDVSNLQHSNDLHLRVSQRSFRAKNVSRLVNEILELDVAGASDTLKNLGKYPIRLTRDLQKAKDWLRENVEGCGSSERYGMMVSSQAERLRPHAIDVRHRIKPVHWFLNDKDDVRSSYYLEDAATEFEVQGLEIDWGGVIWDADLRHNGDDWLYRSFKGSKWQKIEKEDRQTYLKNAYRVLLTRARQGMVIVVPEGDSDDHTRKKEFYDPTYSYLASIGFKTL